MKLGVEPEAVLAAYRVGDSPMNAITPLNAYFALIVTFAQRYQKDAGVGTVIALMLPYVVAMCVVWPLLFVAWHLADLPGGCEGRAPGRSHLLGTQVRNGAAPPPP